MPVKNTNRRDFIKNTSLATAGLWAGGLPFNTPVPSSTSNIGPTLSTGVPMSPEWVKALYKREKATAYLKSKNELQYIGMPVGGINCGTVYLGGDGRLWLWDIFNKNQEGIEPKQIEWGAEGQPKRKIGSRDGACYVQPSKDIRPLEQGVAIKVEWDGRTIIKELKSDDWDEISFEATYPIATIIYADKNLPVSIQLQAYSPFIPLDENSSGLPVTILSYQIKNSSSKPVIITMLGWLENAVNKFSAKEGGGNWINTAVKKTNSTAIFCQFNAIDKNAFKEAGDTGSMCLSCIGNGAAGLSSVSISPVTESSFIVKEKSGMDSSSATKLIGGIVTTHRIEAGKIKGVDFLISWHFKNVGKRINVPDAAAGNFYAAKFADALAVSNYAADNFSSLSSTTKLWQKTWYGSTLPWWFLERTFLNVSTLATTTSHRFATGRSWAWEGVGACEGNCTHVWQYAQAAARVFPAIEKDNRQRVDLGISLMEDGGIWFRGEYDKRPAIDGQAGTILRIYREHQMSRDDSFLKNNWAKIKRAIQFVINQDRNNDGMEDTPMENTLDAVWDGEIAWIVGLCIAAVKAGEMMAIEMKDTDFALACRQYADKGRQHMEAGLFNGEYFIHRPDAIKGRAALGSYNTCHIDQVFGQSWAFQLGLPRVIDKAKTMQALKALWKYNFKADVGPYIKEHTGGRPYALAGEAGMVMNTNPANEPKPYGENVTWQLGYFHECMSGFEHQVASHLMAEGMVDEALVLTRAIHDRYHAFKRNPFNEIECSDHYARAMASYGTFITACGFEYHGPKGYIKFAPKWDKENFKAPFVTAKGWGSFAQKKDGNKDVYDLSIAYGVLQLATISLETISVGEAKRVSVEVGTTKIAATFQQHGGDISIQLIAPVSIKAGERLVVSIV